MTRVDERQESLIPTLSECEEKNRLLKDYVDAIRELVALHDEQTSAVIEGDPDFARFDVLIHMANQRKAGCKYSLFSHLESHHC